MSNSLNAVAAAIQVLVTALVVVEHDREKHIPGVKSGPSAETFLVPEHVAESLIKAGAVKRAEVVDTAALIDQVDTAATGGESSSGLVTTFADVADIVEADQLRAQLAETVSQRDSLIEQLADTQAQLEEAQGKLAEAALAPADQVAKTAADPVETAAADLSAGDSTDSADASAAELADAGAAVGASTETADTGTVEQAAASTKAATSRKAR